MPMLPLLPMLVADVYAAEVDFSCTADDPSGVAAAGGLVDQIVGTAPIAMTCAVEPPITGTWDRATWTLGDGALAEGDTISYSYAEPGQYTVSVRLEGYVDDTAGPPVDEADLSDPQQTKHGYITVCGAPDPAFRLVNKGGLDYQIVNESTIAVHCLDTLQWDVYAGSDPTGTPITTFDGWEPRFELADEGPHTLVLTMTGIGGTTTHDLAFDARFQLTDDLKDGPKACSTGAGAAQTAGALAGLGLLLVRRRRR